jgi:hypothetical protein
MGVKIKTFGEYMIAECSGGEIIGSLSNRDALRYYISGKVEKENVILRR